jgi:hypothetical protein
VIGGRGCDGAHPLTITNCGGFAPCRLERLNAVVLVVVKTRLTNPPSSIKVENSSDVTSTEVQPMALTFPEEPVLVVAAGGALFQLIPPSVQVLSSTPKTS